jgi:hypothetical protein
MPLAAYLVLIAAANSSAQQKLLTVEDIFDPAKRQLQWNHADCSVAA